MLVFPGEDKQYRLVKAEYDGQTFQAPVVWTKQHYAKCKKFFVNAKYPLVITYDESNRKQNSPIMNGPPQNYSLSWRNKKSRPVVKKDPADRPEWSKLGSQIKVGFSHPAGGSSKAKVNEKLMAAQHQHFGRAVDVTSSREEKIVLVENTRRQ